MAQFVFLLHFASTVFLTGVIWLVQLVHYPTFHYIKSSEFQKFCQFHQNSISWVVAPMMVFELITSLYLVVSPVASGKLYLGLGLIALIWLSTFFLSVPLHTKLLLGPQPDVIQNLVLTNWPRTFLWTIRSVLLLEIARNFVKI